MASNLLLFLRINWPQCMHFSTCVLEKERSGFIYVHESRYNVNIKILVAKLLYWSGSSRVCRTCSYARVKRMFVSNCRLPNRNDYIWYFVNTPVPSVNYCDGLDRCILYCILFVFMLALLCFCVASEFSVNKDLYTLCLRKKQDTKLLPITSPNVNRFSKFFHCQTHR